MPAPTVDCEEELSDRSSGGAKFSEIDTIIKHIRQEGIACIPSYFSKSQIDEANTALSHVPPGELGTEHELERSEYHYMIGQHLASDALAQMCSQICHQLDSRYDGATDRRLALRRINDDVTDHRFYYFHFDSYRLTLFAPLRIPPSGHRGELLIFPKQRKFPRSYFKNIIDKILYGNKPSQIFWKRRSIRFRSYCRVVLVPGNLYILDGSRTLYADAHLDPGGVHDSLVLHYAQTHRTHWIRVLRDRLH
jgi:hypothetical protein